MGVRTLLRRECSDLPVRLPISRYEAKPLTTRVLAVENDTLIYLRPEALARDRHPLPGIDREDFGRACPAVLNVRADDDLEIAPLFQLAPWNLPHELLVAYQHARGLGSIHIQTRDRDHPHSRRWVSESGNQAKVFRDPAQSCP